MIKAFVLIALLIVSYAIQACTCAGKMNYERDYQLSDLVFIGEVIYSDSNEFTFQVYENLKSADSATYEGEYTSSCDVLPLKDEKWLVYANFDKDGKIFIGDCSSSRSFSNVFSSDGYEFVPPPKKLDFNAKDFYFYLMMTTNRELIEFYEEINSLRIKKINTDLSLLKDTLVQENHESESFDLKFYVLLILILINTALLFYFRGNVK